MIIFLFIDLLIILLNNSIMEEETKNCKRNNNVNTAAGCGGFYGLGFIGAAIYFISQAASFGAGLIGFLKALVWPAFLVYELLKFLKL